MKNYIILALLTLSSHFPTKATSGKKRSVTQEKRVREVLKSNGKEVENYIARMSKSTPKSQAVIVMCAVRMNKNFYLARMLAHDYNTKFNTQRKQPLHFAAENGNLEAVHLLLSNGKKGQVNQKTSTKKTALHFAASNDHYGIVGYLLTNGALVNARDGTGNTPLHCALYNNNASIVLLLTQHGARTDIPNKKEQTQWQLAQEKGLDFNLIRLATTTPTAVSTQQNEAPPLILETSEILSSRSSDLPSHEMQESHSTASDREYSPQLQLEPFVPHTDLPELLL